MDNFFTKYSEQIVIASLIVFILIGCGILYLFIVLPADIPFYAWIFPAGFILIPGLILKSILGFGSGGLSEKQLKQIEDGRESLLFDDKGVTLVMPLMGSTWFIGWDSIETIIYTDYRSDDHAWFEFTLNTIPDYKLHENSWWLAKLFPSKPKRQWVRINSDAKHFSQLPDAVKKYLELNQPVDFSDSRKGALVDRKQEIKNGVSVTTEHWKPKQDYEPVQLVFDRQGRALEEL